MTTGPKPYVKILAVDLARVDEAVENAAFVLAGQPQRAGQRDGSAFFDRYRLRCPDLDELVGQRMEVKRTARRIGEQHEMALARGILERHHPAGDADRATVQRADAFGEPGRE